MEEKNKKPKDLQTALDCAVRDSKNKSGGYVINDAVTYWNYMKNADWSTFLSKISGPHKYQFDNGSGGELKGGKYPPKMASFGSSSRLVYELSHSIPGFSFEERLDTRVGGIAHLDGFCKRETNYIYVEAKMREIYGASHKNESIKKVYSHVYEHLQDNIKEFKFEKIEDKTDATKSKVTFKINNEPVTFFDLKQLICHFLGITYDIAKHPIQNVKVKFLYLLYNPHEIKESIDKRYRELLIDRYEIVREFIDNRNNIKVFESIFQDILSYQVKEQNLPKDTHIEFEMKLVDQNEYTKEF